MAHNQCHILIHTTHLIFLAPSLLADITDVIIKQDVAKNQRNTASLFSVLIFSEYHTASCNFIITQYVTLI